MENSKLTAERVKKILIDSLFRDSEVSKDHAVPDGAIVVEGIMGQYGFHPERLNSHRDEVIEMLNELPEQFFKKSGGGWTFLNACNDRHGIQWGEHSSMEALFALAIGLGLARYCLPRSMWPILPGGMPYIEVEIPEAA